MHLAGETSHPPESAGDLTGEAVHLEGGPDSPVWRSERDVRSEDNRPQPGYDLIWPLCNLFDLTPEGRGEKWYPRLSY